MKLECVLLLPGLEEDSPIPLFEFDGPLLLKMIDILEGFVAVHTQARANVLKRARPAFQH